MSDARIGRLLRLMTVLRARAARRPKELAAELEVSERTVYRDLNALAAIGLPVSFDNDSGGYRVGGDFFLPPVQLTLAEALAISLLGSELGRRRQVPFLEDAWRAVIKIRSQLPQSVREEVADADSQIRVDAARVSPQEGCEQHFETLRRAIAERRKVRCSYDSGAHGCQGPFLFRPYTLLFSQRAWYVIGYSELRGAERSLKLNRFIALAPTNRPYMIPPEWSVERCLGKAWRMIRGDRRHQVMIRFDREAGRNVADTLWHPTQTIAWEADACLFACEVDGLEEIVWWILGYGPHAEVIYPNELRSMVQQLTTDTARLYAMEKRRPPQQNSPRALSIR